MKIRVGGPRARRALKAVAVGTMVVAVAAAMTTSSVSAPSGDSERKTDDISHSSNVKEVTNVPKRQPVANTASDLAFHGDGIGDVFELL